MPSLGISIGTTLTGGMGRQQWRSPYSDNFNRADANLEASALTLGGWSWVHDGTIAGAAVIESGHIRCATSNTTGSAYKTPDLGSANHYVQHRVSSLVTVGMFICCRLADRSNFLGMRISSTGVEIYKRIAGTLTLVGGTANPLPVVGDVFRLEAVGTAWTRYRNGVSEVTGEIDAALTSTGTGFVCRSTTTPTIDDFEAGLV